MGVDPSDQQLYFLGFPLAEPEMQITEFLQMSKTFNLVLPEEDDDKSILFGRSPRGFASDKEMFLVTGARLNFTSILLRSNSEEWMKLKSKRFGVVQDIEGESSGSRVFQVRIYEVKEEGSISLRTVDGTNKVFLVTEEGEEKPLTPVDTKKYDESLNAGKKLGPLDHARKILPFLNTLAKLLRAGEFYADPYKYNTHHYFFLGAGVANVGAEENHFF